MSMPTKEAQAIIDAAIPVAIKYATLKRHIAENPPLIILDGDGSIEPHYAEGLDATVELNELLSAVADFSETFGAPVSRNGCNLQTEQQ